MGKIIPDLYPKSEPIKLAFSLLQQMLSVTFNTRLKTDKFCTPRYERAGSELEDRLSEGKRIRFGRCCSPVLSRSFGTAGLWRLHAVSGLVFIYFQLV